MFAADWALKRLCKFLLKRNLKHLLRTEIDLDQLELGKGMLELKEVLLNECYLSEQLVGHPPPCTALHASTCTCYEGRPSAAPRQASNAGLTRPPLRRTHAPQSGSGWEVTAGLVGTVRVVVPLAAFYSESVRVELEDVLLTLRPCRAASSAEAAGGPQQPDSPAVPTEAAAAAAAMSDGVKLIAGGIESLLRRMRVQAAGVVVRLEIPKNPDGGSCGGHHAVLVRLEAVQYGSSEEEEAEEQAPLGDDPPSALRVSRRIAFSGLALEIEQPEPAASASYGDEGGLPPNPAVLLSGLGGGGVSGLVQLHLSSGPQLRLHPGVAVSVQIESAQLQVHQQHALAVVGIVAALQAAMGSRSREPSSQDDEAHSAPMAVPPDHHWGRQSFIQGLLLPDCEGIVADALMLSKLSAPGDHAENEVRFL